MDKNMNQDKDRRDFYRICIFSTMLAFGVLAAAIESVQVDPHFDFQASRWTLLAFLIGALISWLLWQGFFLLANRRKKNEGGTRLP
jgi:hypothetical protein